MIPSQDTEAIMDEWVCVFESGNAALVSLAKSMLEQAEIPHISRNEHIQDLFGVGRIGPGFNLITGPIQLQVKRQFADLAREDLKDIATEKSYIRKQSWWHQIIYRWTLIFVVLSYLGPLSIFVILIGIAYWGALSLLGLFTKRYLHKQGYTWVRFAEARRIFLKIGRKAYMIPRAEDVEKLPGFERNAEHLIAVAKAVKKDKGKKMQ